MIRRRATTTRAACLLSVCTLLGAGSLVLQPAAAQAVETDSISVVTYNIGGRSMWIKNGCAIAQSLDTTSPMVILVQEATTDRLPDKPNESTFTQLRDALKNKKCGVRRSYASATGTVHTYGRTTPPYSRGAHIFYDPTRVTFVQGEERDFGKLVPTSDQAAYYANFKSGFKAVYYAMARFKVTASGRTFLAASVHATCRTCTTDNTLRLKHVSGGLKNLGLRAAKWNANDPMIVGGDFNQDPTTAGDTIHPAMRSGGFVNTRPAGHTTKTFVTTKIAVNYDHIFYRPARTSAGYLRASTRAFATHVRSPEPSDHRMVSATVRFGR